MDTEGDIPIQIGDMIADKFRVERILGSGAMGVVVAAKHVDLQELRAIKLMLRSSVDRSEGVERFLREARAASRLKTEHVVKVYDVGRLPDGAPYMVMEHLKGMDLKTLLNKHGALPQEEAVRYVRQACEGIAEAHAAGIVHRDLKPANLFLAKGADGAVVVKVLDFGIAKILQAQDEGRAEITKTSQLLGTPLYMSPEQMRSTRSVDARADIWSLGVILYRAIVGKVPYQGETITQICAAVITETPAAPSSIKADIWPGLEALIMRCLEKDPQKRYANAAELAKALEPYEDPETAKEASSVASASTRARDVGDATANALGLSTAPPGASSFFSGRTPVIAGMLVAALAVGGAYLRSGRPKAPAEPPAAAAADVAPVVASTGPKVEPAAVALPPAATASVAPTASAPVAVSASAPPATPAPSVAVAPTPSSSVPKGSPGAKPAKPAAPSNARRDVVDPWADSK